MVKSLRLRRGASEATTSTTTTAIPITTASQPSTVPTPDPALDVEPELPEPPPLLTATTTSTTTTSTTTTSTTTTSTTTSTTTITTTTARAESPPCVSRSDGAQSPPIGADGLLVWCASPVQTCPVCGESLSELAGGAEEHINACLDQRTVGGRSAGPEPVPAREKSLHGELCSDDSDSDDFQARGPAVCPACECILAHVGQAVAAAHIAQCCERIRRMPTATCSRASASGEDSVVSSAACPLCDKRLGQSSLAQLVAHIKRCGSRHGLATEQWVEMLRVLRADVRLLPQETGRRHAASPTVFRTGPGRANKAAEERLRSAQANSRVLRTTHEERLVLVRERWSRIQGYARRFFVSAADPGWSFGRDTRVSFQRGCN
jgi:hypothetical protein